MKRPIPLLLALSIGLPALGAAEPPPQVVADWLLQDNLPSPQKATKQAVAAVLDALGKAGDDLRDELATADLAGTPLADLYLKACERRRKARLQPHLGRLARIVFTKHYDLGGSHYAYTEGQSDAQAERHFQPGASLCLVEMDGLYGKVRTLLDDPKGVIRDPDVSCDGTRILFAWKKDDRKDDYHLYEMSAADGQVRQLTDGLGFADYEGAYLPNGDIVFNSTRCVQTVDCWWTEVSNLYTCDRDGRHLRRLTFDQVHTNYPQVTPDGRVIYTRWDYNDRGQIYPQGLFQMNPDGTGQSEVYGNNSWFPTAILHARAIPGTTRYVAVLSGHHTRQQGWLGLIDPVKGRQENAGAQLIAPVRPTPAVHVDRYGQSGDQFQYPYPIGETEFIVAFKPEKAPRFAIYLMAAYGRRELLAWDPGISCSQPVPLAPRPAPHVRPRLADYSRNDATIYMQDIYTGPGLDGIQRGSVKKLRVVALDFRAAGIGSNGNGGPAGGAMISTPVSIQGTWDVKIVLGTATVREDGSACFNVPARTPIYFQALDSKGFAIQTMRSWVSLQPGEAVSCVGCHEYKNAAPRVAAASRALLAGPQALALWQGEPRGFSFNREIQPILDHHCVRCHHLDAPPRYGHAPAPPGPGAAPEVTPAFSLRGRKTLDGGSRRLWSDSYKALANRAVANWINIQSEPSMLPPYHAGAARSKLITMLAAGHSGVRLSPEEIDRFAAWIDLLVPYCGDYTEDMDPAGVPRYQHFLDKRRRWEAQEAGNIRDLLQSRLGAN